MAVNPFLRYLLSDASPGGLAPSHRQDLEASGLTEETIRRHRIRSVPPGMIPRLTGFDMPGASSAMLIPFPDPSGEFMNHVRIKVFPPLTDRAGHSIKYLQPRRSGVRLFFPLLQMFEALRGSGPMWLVEGEKKALAVAQLGIPAVGFCGIEGWHASGSSALLPDFRFLRLTGRVIDLVPDGDWQSNAAVARGAFRLAQALETRGTRVRLVVLPDEAL
jgi:hypothetical protein